MAQVALDYFFEKRRVRRRGFVAITVADLGQALGKSASQVRRIMNVLTQAGQLLRVYNGGQGARRRCVFYVGEIAVRRAAAEWPVWDAKKGDKPAFGPLRMGRRVLEQRQKKDRKNAILRADDSSSEEGASLREAPPSETGGVLATFAAESDAPPRSPPVGGPLPAAATVADAGGDPLRVCPTVTPASAQNGSRPHDPHSPAKSPDSSPKGARPEKKRSSRDGSSGVPAALVVERRAFVNSTWGYWRERYRRRHRRDYIEHAADGRAMNRIVATALLRVAGSHDAAKLLLRYRFGRYLADPCPPGSPLGESHHPLFKLARIFDEYGMPPVGFGQPTSGNLGEGRSQGELERVTGAGKNGFGPVPKPEPHDPGGGPRPMKKRVEPVGLEEPAELGERDGQRLGGHGRDPIEWLAKHRKILGTVEQLYARRLIGFSQVEKQRALVARLEREANQLEH